jgi:hypothetical protein
MSGVQDRNAVSVLITGEILVDMCCILLLYGECMSSFLLSYSLITPSPPNTLMPLHDPSQDATCYCGGLDPQVTEELLWELMIQVCRLSWQTSSCVLYFWFSYFGETSSARASLVCIHISWDLVHLPAYISWPGLESLGIYSIDSLVLPCVHTFHAWRSYTSHPCI